MVVARAIGTMRRVFFHHRKVDRSLYLPVDSAVLPSPAQVVNQDPMHLHDRYAPAIWLAYS